jgi:undecaprenyl diphosphate synthase
MNGGKIQYSDLTADRSRIPSHIAIIMDGNGRWAKQQGLNRVNGHNEGVNSARDAIESSVDLGVKYLTLYVFSKENWNRPEFEVNCLMALLVETIFKEIDSLMEKNVRVIPIGEIDDLPATQENLSTMSLTEQKVIPE